MTFTEGCCGGRRKAAKGVALCAQSVSTVYSLQSTVVVLVAVLVVSSVGRRPEFRVQFPLGNARMCNHRPSCLWKTVVVFIPASSSSSSS